LSFSLCSDGIESQFYHPHDWLDIGLTAVSGKLFASSTSFYIRP
jgi:hypothetical protein